MNPQVIFECCDKTITLTDSDMMPVNISEEKVVHEYQRNLVKRAMDDMHRQVAFWDYRSCNKDGFPVMGLKDKFKFGKYEEQGSTLLEVLKKNTYYIKWMLKERVAYFTDEATEVIERTLDMVKKVNKNKYKKSPYMDIDEERENGHYPEY